jgi:hypothetical protein
MAITLKQTSQATSATTTSTTLSLAYASSVTAGSLLVVCCAANNATTTFSITDLGAAANSFSMIAATLSTMPTNAFRTQIGFCQNCNAGACTPQFTVTSCTEREIWIFEFAGAAASGQPDASNQGSGTGTAISASVTVVSAGSMLLGATIGFAPTVTIDSANYTAGAVANGNPSEYNLSETTGAHSVAFTNSISASWAVSAASFAAAAVAAAVPTFTPRRMPLGI